jgi:hypothetical protein
MAARVHRLHKAIAFSANIIGGSVMSSVNSYGTHVQMWLWSQRHISNPHERFFIPNYHLYQTDHFPGRKGIPHNPVDLPPISIEAMGVCIPTGNSEVLLATVCKSPGHAWNDADINELLSCRYKLLLAGDLNAKYPFWNSIVSNPSGAKLPNLLHMHVNEFETSAHNVPLITAGNDDVLDIVAHKNVQLSEVIVS